MVFPSWQSFRALSYYKHRILWSRIQITLILASSTKTSKAFLLFDSQLWALPLPAPSSKGEGSGEGSFVGQILAHFPQLLGRFRRQVCRAQVDRVPMTCYHRPHFKDVEPEALRGQESPASDPFGPSQVLRLSLCIACGSPATTARASSKIFRVKGDSSVNVYQTLSFARLRC